MCVSAPLRDVRRCYPSARRASRRDSAPPLPPPAPAPAPAPADAESKRLPYRTLVEAPSLFAALGDVAGARVLDLGCGSGHFARALLARGAREVVGVDLSAAMVGLARRGHADEPRARFLVGDAMRPQELRALALGEFDVVLGAYLLNYADSPAGLRAMAASVAAHLAPAGRFVGVNDAFVETTAAEPAPAGAPQPFRFSRQVVRAGCGGGACACSGGGGGGGGCACGGGVPGGCACGGGGGAAAAAPRVRLRFFKADGLTEICAFDNYLLGEEAYVGAFAAEGLALARAPLVRVLAAAGDGAAPSTSEEDWARFMAAPPLVALVARRRGGAVQPA